MSGNRLPLFLMAKAPIAGEVKTRMQPQLTPQAAADLACMMLERTVATAHRHWRGEVQLCVSPHANHPTFRDMQNQYGIKIIPQLQINANLGARMLAALRGGVEDARAAAVVGCDVPHCAGEIFESAYEMLMRGENPIGPATDGGFYLLGLQRDVILRDGDALFADVEWSSAKVLSQVRANAADIKLSDLPTLRDIDRHADLQWLAEQDAAYQPFVA